MLSQRHCNTCVDLLYTHVVLDVGEDHLVAQNMLLPEQCSVQSDQPTRILRGVAGDLSKVWFALGEKQPYKHQYIWPTAFCKRNQRSNTSFEDYPQSKDRPGSPLAGAEHTSNEDDRPPKHRRTSPAWNNLLRAGWFSKKPPGRGLSDLYRYIQPGCDANGEAGVDYFLGEAALLEYYNRPYETKETLARFEARANVQTNGQSDDNGHDSHDGIGGCAAAGSDIAGDGIDRECRDGHLEDVRGGATEVTQDQSHSGLDCEKPTSVGQVGMVAPSIPGDCLEIASPNRGTLNSIVCAVCHTECTTDRSWTDCGKYIHHFCSHDVCLSLNLRDADGATIKDFGDSSYCRTQCYMRATTSTAGCVDLVVETSARHTYKAPSNSSGLISADVAPRSENPRRLHSSLSTLQEQPTVAAQNQPAARHNAGGKPSIPNRSGRGNTSKPAKQPQKKRKEKRKEALPKAKPTKKTLPQTLKAELLRRLHEAAAKFVNASVAFCPVDEEKTPNSQNRDVGSTYLTGVVTRFEDGKEKVLTESRYLRHYTRSIGQAQLSKQKIMFIYYQSRSFRKELQIPQSPGEAEQIPSMTFSQTESLGQPIGLFTHPDGTSATRLREESHRYFGHSATSSFFAFVPLSFWNQVVVFSNEYADNSGSPSPKAISLDELMTFLGILWYMTLFDKGEMRNYWTDGEEATIFPGARSTSLGSIMTWRSWHFPHFTMTLKGDNKPRGFMKQGVCLDKHIVAASWVDGSIVNIVSNADASGPTTVYRRIRNAREPFAAPICIAEYNIAMQGVDRHDQLRGRFSLCGDHSFQKWHKKLAMALLDIARCNAFICDELARGNSLDRSSAEDPQSSSNETLPGRDRHRAFVVGLVRELFSGEWKKCIETENGMLYASGPSPAATRTTPETTSNNETTLPIPSLVMCVANESWLALKGKSRTMRECTICKFECRTPTQKTDFCRTHHVALCKPTYSVDHSKSHLCLEASWTCWQKFHYYYMPKLLYSVDGNLRRSSPTYKAQAPFLKERRDAKKAYIHSYPPLMSC
ncbi:unnamed protein product [Phytophthora fragariaefolia]|uniref:Unnamed protein product n=1 Tax=Phytophthora fragariaefolia TaxID=1490495 RepID=A0A9W6XRX2_9STRA|nr:unnamed protein product [Phytophthora fragariaefolia]